MALTRALLVLNLTFATLFPASLQAQASGQPSGARGTALGRPWDSNPAILFLSQYGLENFPAQYIDAFQTLVQAQARVRSGKYAAAKTLLDGLWARYPVGTPVWSSLPTQPFGINLGTPPSYYGLRMLTDTVDWHVGNPGAPPPPRSARLTVVLVGEAQGLEPQSVNDLFQGTGVPVSHALDPRLLDADHQMLRDSLWLFEQYVVAMTEGQLGVELNVVHLPDLSLPVQASGAPGSVSYAGLVNASQVLTEVSEETLEGTDWWWVIYPSHVPEHVPVFETTEFVTGGMGTGPQASPMFIVDDRWLVRKPPHLGSGDYARVERMTYLPQWLQHEFFHHLFRTYPEFGLEATPHQWFNLGTWPPDFVGLYEPDYFHEALVKRLQTATPPLHVALRYATADAPWDELTAADLLGTYQREPVQNPWHIGDIQLNGPAYRWLNTAPVGWNLADDVLNGRLLTGPDCPYFGSPLGNSFDIVLERDALGDLTAEVLGFSFNGELYEKQ